MLENDDGSFLHVWDDLTYDDLLNHVRLVQIRSELSSNHLPKICQNCLYLNSHGVPSPQKIEMERSAGILEQIEECTNIDGRTSFYFRTLDISMENVCNLSCKMCNHYYSYRHIIKVGQRKKFRWISDFISKKIFSEIVQKIDHLSLQGGEPLIHPEHLRLLDKVHAIRPNITLSYTTNLSLISSSVYSRWNNFQRIGLNISIDGVHEIFETIRFPLRWETFDENLRQVICYGASHNDLYISFAFTLQRDNFFKIDSVIDYLISFGKSNKLNPFPSIIELKFPPALSFVSIPVRDREIYYNLLKAKEQVWINKSDQGFHFSLKSILDHYLSLISYPESKELEFDYVCFTKIYEACKNTIG